MHNPKMQSLLRCKKSTSQYGLQTARFHAIPHRVDRANLRKLETNYRHGTVFAPKQSLCHKEATGMQNQKCNLYFGAKSLLRSRGLQTARFHAAPYRADSANLRKLGATFRHGTVFAPKNFFYQKEATGMQTPKLQSLLRCKRSTSQYTHANYPLSCSAV